MNAVKERTSALLDIGLRNAAGRLQAPLSITYRIDDIDSGLQIRPWTALDPASSMSLALTSTDNRMLGEGDQEKRMVTVVASYGPDEDDQAADEYLYTVQRLRFLGAA